MIHGKRAGRERRDDKDFPGRTAVTASMRDGDDTTMLDWLTPLVRRWRLMVGVPLTAAVITAALSFVVPPVYTASTAFTPEGGETGQLSAGLAGLAGQFGLTLGGGAGGSPDFFAQLVVSRELIDSLLSSRFAVPGPELGDAPPMLLDLLLPDGETELERRQEAGRRMRDRISVRVDRRSQIVTVSVEAPSASLAADIANRLIVLLNEFNLGRRQFRSQAQRRFVGERLEAAREALSEAEAVHLQFLTANRRFEESPVLQFEENRLQRDVQLRQEVFATLSREYEQARIAEVRDTPVLTIVDHATPPNRRSRPQRKRLVLIVIIVTGALAAGLAYLAEYRRAAASAGGGSYASFRDAWRQLVSDVGGGRGRRPPSRGKPPSGSPPE